MGRLPSLRTFTACALLPLAGSAAAAELTHVASSADPDHPFEVDLTVHWDRTLRRAKVTEETASGQNAPYGMTVDGTELRYQQVTNAVVPRIAVGIWHDLEIHAEMPYVLNDDHSWRYAFVNGVSTQGTSSIANNTITPSGTACSGACPTFPVPSNNQLLTTYHGATLGDLTAGITWGILSDKRDPTKPFWLVGLDVTAPTAAVYDPFLSYTYQLQGGPRAPVGQGIWAYDLYTAASKKFGAADTYVRAHYRLPALSSKTYSNCNHAADLYALQQSSDAYGNCSDPTTRSAAEAKPPTVLGFTFGTEISPYEDAAQGQKVSIDLRVGLDRYGQSRWYNELTDAARKLLWTDAYTNLYGLLGLYLRPSRYVQLRAEASFGTDLSHFISGEPLQLGALQNPNYDFRYDTAGRRFRVTESTIFATTVAADIYF